MQYTLKQLKNAFPGNFNIHGRKYWRSYRHGVGVDAAPRDFMDFRMEERDAHNLVSSPYRLDLIEQLILAHN